MEHLNGSTSSAPSGIAIGAAPAVRQVLTFTLGSRADDAASDTAAGVYGIDLADVQEIRGYTPATPIPNTPDYIKGAINLRGAIVPVIDLRIRFGVDRLAYTKFTVIVIVHVEGKTIGLVADGVSDVLTLKAADVLPPPDFGAGRNGECMEGIAVAEGGLVLLLNLRRMLAPDGIVDPATALNPDSPAVQSSPESGGPLEAVEA